MNIPRGREVSKHCCKPSSLCTQNLSRREENTSISSMPRKKQRAEKSTHPSFLVNHPSRQVLHRKVPQPTQCPSLMQIYQVHPCSAGENAIYNAFSERRFKCNEERPVLASLETPSTMQSLLQNAGMSVAETQCRVLMHNTEESDMQNAEVNAMQNAEEDESRVKCIVFFTW